MLLHSDVLGQAHLVVPQPQPVVSHAEADHVIMEGLAPGVALGRGEDVCEHLLQQLQMGLLIKGLQACQCCLSTQSLLRGGPQKPLSAGQSLEDQPDTGDGRAWLQGTGGQPCTV